jgi:serine/threonine protein kinase
VSRCPTCQSEFDKGEQFCPKDGSPLSTSSHAADPLVGRVLGGRYRLTDRLGQGGMGTVYRAVHTLMDKPLAVKILRGELSTDTEAIARFHREARSASRLDHDHCIRVTDFGQTEDRLLYLAMELLEGRSLTQRIKESSMPIAEAAQIAHAVAQALEHAHEAGIIHRDLKPDNVFLARRPRGREIVKVLDFGLAKLADDSGKSRSITRDGTVFGTPEYMAPEQAQGEPLDPRTDLYALGVLLFHMLTGELPFRAETFVALLTKHVRDVPPRPSDLEPSIPPELETIVLTCMQKKPAQRYPSATALAEALLPFVPRADPTGKVTPVQREPSGGNAVVQTAPVAAADATASSALQQLPSESEDSLDAVVRPPRRGLRATLVVAGVALAAGIAWASAHSHFLVGPPAGPKTTVPASELGEVQRLVEAGKLDEAAAQLELLHRNGESAALERTTGEVAERRGRRLEALAHLHRAKTLAPADPTVRAALAALLLRLDQKLDACNQARRALDLASTQKDNDTIGVARGILKGAACPAQ